LESDQKMMAQKIKNHPGGILEGKILLESDRKKSLGKK